MWINSRGDVRRILLALGLNDVYQPIRSIILAKDPLPNVKDAFYVVSREESHEGLYSGGSSTNKPQHAAFVAKTNNNSNRFNRRVNTNNNNNTNRGPNPNFLCKNCGLIGHTMERCYALIGYPVGFKRNPNLSRQYGNYNKRFNANCEVNQSVPSTSGSLSSSFTNEQMVKLLSPYAYYGLPNSTLAKISAIGNLRLSSGIVLFDVFVILEYNDLNQGKIMGTSSESGGLYLFDLNEIGKCVNPKCNYVFVCHVSSELWHCRLGHPADQVLSILGNKLGFSKRDHMSPCDICHKAKKTKEPFPLSDHKTKSVGDMIHCDVWGPYRVVSKDGYKKIRTLVDDLVELFGFICLNLKQK
ncbi:ribonuclease H-like domain-containing protein [Tanacetum coccineum]